MLQRVWETQFGEYHAAIKQKVRSNLERADGVVLARIS